MRTHVCVWNQFRHLRQPHIFEARRKRPRSTKPWPNDKHSCRGFAGLAAWLELPALVVHRSASSKALYSVGPRLERRTKCCAQAQNLLAQCVHLCAGMVIATFTDRKWRRRHRIRARSTRRPGPARPWLSSGRTCPMGCTNRSETRADEAPLLSGIPIAKVFAGKRNGHAAGVTAKNAAVPPEASRHWRQH